MERKPATPIPNRLQECRKKKGLSQIEAVALLGLKSASTLAKWEKGLAYPTLDQFLKLEELYQANETKLYGELRKKLKKEIEKKLKK